MDWTAPIDLYCERLAPGPWAEPANALSNLGFVLVAAAAVTILCRRDNRDPVLLGLVALVAVIGLGSFLFHVFANTWSVIADVFPITAFIYAYLGLALRRFLALGWPAVAAFLLLFFIASWPVEAVIRPVLAGSAAYAPPLLAMVLIGTILLLRRHPAGRSLLAAGLIFAVSLTFRTLDLPLCPAFPLGTHFIWHLLNAATLGILLFAAIIAERTPYAPTAASSP